MRYETSDTTTSHARFTNPAKLPPTLWNKEVFGSDLEGRRFFLDTGEHIAISYRVIQNVAVRSFKEHERKWKEETKFLSSLTEKYLHPSYARIIGMGWPAVSLILRSLQRQPDDWFYALRAITGENPVPMEVAGNMRAMAEIWIAWGKSRNLI